MLDGGAVREAKSANDVNALKSICVCAVRELSILRGTWNVFTHFKGPYGWPDAFKPQWSNAGVSQ